MVCCHCGSRDAVAAHQMIGYRNMREACIKKKQPLIKGSMKSNPKRVMQDFKKKAQKKRKVSNNDEKTKAIEVKKESGIIEDEDDSSSSSEDVEFAGSDSDSETDTENDSSDSDDSSIIAHWDAPDSDAAERAITSQGPRARENLHKICNPMHRKHSLARIDAPPLGDCMPQSCLVGCFNLHRKLTDEEEMHLSQFDWSLSNMVSKGKSLLRGAKCDKRRNHSVGSILNQELHMSCDDIGAIACMLGMKIIVVAPHKRKNGSSHVNLQLFVPVEGSVARSHQHPLKWHDDFQMHRPANKKTMEREHYDLKEFIDSKEGIIIEFHATHHQAIAHGKARDIIWPELESDSIFGTKEDKKCCAMCHKLTYADEPNCAECVLCKLWIHSHEGTTCLKHWTENELNDLSEEDNFYCCTCIDKLLAFQRSTGEESAIENIINCLRSFNLKDVTIWSRKEIELLHVIIGRALGDDSD